MTNPLFRNALNRIPQNTPPIWFMRQAGRYHSHYQDLKKNYSFEDFKQHCSSARTHLINCHCGDEREFSLSCENVQSVTDLLSR